MKESIRHIDLSSRIGINSQYSKDKHIKRLLTQLNLANQLTFLRLVLIPFFVISVLEGRFGVALGLFLIAAVTDLLDGYLARRRGAETRIGTLLDPVADKILVMTALIVLVAVPRLNEWGVIMAIAILGREIAVTGLRAMASAEGVVMPAAPMGKWKTGFQIAALTGLLLHYPSFGISMHLLGMVLLVIATGITMWSGYVYFAAYLSRRGTPSASP